MTVFPISENDLYKYTKFITQKSTKFSSFSVVLWSQIYLLHFFFSSGLICAFIVWFWIKKNNFLLIFTFFKDLYKSHIEYEIVIYFRGSQPVGQATLKSTSFFSQSRVLKFRKFFCYLSFLIFSLNRTDIKKYFLICCQALVQCKTKNKSAVL